MGSNLKKKIMVVDDEPDVAFTVEYNLNKADNSYDISHVNNGKQCIELLENKQIPDLILLDIMMPEMSGWEVYKKLKENPDWKKIPVVFLTARNDLVAKKAGSFLGDDYIEKPYDPTDLKKRIDKLLDGK